MANVPCPQCAELIGARSEVQPHAQLNLMKYRKDGNGNPLAHLAEFYRCSLCNSLLVRDPPRLGPDGKWDWI
jgi:hypothetical protein